MGHVLSESDLPRLFGGTYFNLIRRPAAGGLVLSADRWRLDSVDADGLRFVAEAPEAPVLLLPRDQIQRIFWDQLPKQRSRFQVRFELTSGDLWTFSGHGASAAGLVAADGYPPA